MRIAILQIGIFDGEPAKNVQHVLDILSSAESADLYLLPELWTTGYDHSSWPAAADDVEQVLGAVEKFAAKRQAWVVGSVLSRNSTGKLVNRCWLVGPEGQREHYDKVHLFPLMDEDKYLAAGSRSSCFDIGLFKAAPSICFDLRFPEAYRTAAAAGVNLFLVSSEWPHPRAATLRLLATARAAENQAYLALSNRVGLAKDGTKFCGGSVLIGPDGAVIVEAIGSGEEVLYADIDVTVSEKVRKAIPVLTMRVAGVDF